MKGAFMKIWMRILPVLLAATWAAAGAEPKCKDCHGYKDVRIREFPIAMQCWTFRKFTWEEAVEKTKALGVRYLEAYPGQPLSTSMPGAVFGQDMTAEQRLCAKNKLTEAGIRLVAYGVVSIGETEESARQVFDFARDMGIEVVNTEPSFDDWTLLDRLVDGYNIKVSIHNHPTPNKYADPGTVLGLAKGRDRRIGSGADTGHWLRSGVDPVEALLMLRGRVVHCHLKDLEKFGKKDAKDVPFGSGVANIHDILAELTLQGYNGYLSIEHENPAEVDNPSPSIQKGLDYITGITYFKGYQPLVKQWGGRYNLHGWNHYGPGHFLIDAATGELTGQDGMGLLWFSERKFKDFVLELDYKCAEVFTNSGIFLRVPEVPTSDGYIYQSFEIQIWDGGDAKHATGAVYDAVPASQKRFTEPGKWNHFRITFQGNILSVELNGKTVVDKWAAQPAGKVKSLSPEGYIGLQNHDSRAPVYFKNILVKEL
jgi:sugar phosphate isomerase/epimerase